MKKSFILLILLLFTGRVYPEFELDSVVDMSVRKYVSKNISHLCRIDSIIITSVNNGKLSFDNKTRFEFDSSARLIKDYYFLGDNMGQWQFNYTTVYIYNDSVEVKEKIIASNEYYSGKGIQKIDYIRNTDLNIEKDMYYTLVLDKWVFNFYDSISFVRGFVNDTIRNISTVYRIDSNGLVKDKQIFLHDTLGHLVFKEQFTWEADYNNNYYWTVDYYESYFYDNLYNMTYKSNSNSDNFFYTFDENGFPNTFNSEPVEYEMQDSNKIIITYYLWGKQYDFYKTYTYFYRKYSPPTEFIEKPVNETEIFPNPAINFIYIQNTGNLNLLQFIRIFDASGNIIRTINSTNFGENMKIDISDLPEGIYFVYINGNKKSEWKNFVKIR